MEWSKEKNIEFLRIFQTEPCLWDLREKAFKDRVAQNDAWRRIMYELPFPTTIEDLKKKKETLMGYYRVHLNKFKKSLQSGADPSSVYTTSWYAFDIMHSFLKPVYDGSSGSTLTAENTAPPPSLDFSTESVVPQGQETTFYYESPPQLPPQNQNPNPNQNPSQILPTPPVKPPRKRIQPNFYEYDVNDHFVTKKLLLETSAVKNQMSEAIGCIKSLSHQAQSHKQDLDECDHFAFMIAAKIRKISDANERETLMNAVQNLVYQSMVKNTRTESNKNHYYPEQ